MNLLSKSYQTVSFDLKRSTLTQIWNKNTYDIGITAFKDSMLALVSEVKFYHPNHVVLDFKALGFTVNIMLQTWIAEVIIPKLERLRVHKMAVIHPHKLLPKVATGQWVDEVNDSENFLLEITCVDTESAAIAWLYYDVNYG